LSKSPRVLGNIGYCAMKLERNSESVAAYREYERAVTSIDPTERRQIDQDLGTMTDGSATLNARFTGPGAWTLVDERVPVRGTNVTNTYASAGPPLTLLLHPGHHLLHVKVGEEEQGRWEVDASGGASLTHVFEPKPAAPVAVAAQPDLPEEAPPSRAPQIVMMGLGGAALVAGAITGGLALSKLKTIENECPGNRCPPGTSYRGDVSAASSLGTATDTLLIGGGVILAAGTSWFLLSGGHRERRANRSPAVTGACVPGRCALSLQGSF
jgi:hypothetical protein